MGIKEGASFGKRFFLAFLVGTLIVPALAQQKKPPSKISRIVGVDGKDLTIGMDKREVLNLFPVDSYLLSNEQKGDKWVVFDREKKQYVGSLTFTNDKLTEVRRPWFPPSSDAAGFAMTIRAAVADLFQDPKEKSHDCMVWTDATDSPTEGHADSINIVGKQGMVQVEIFEVAGKRLSLVGQTIYDTQISDSPKHRKTKP